MALNGTLSHLATALRGLQDHSGRHQIKRIYLRTNRGRIRFGLNEEKLEMWRHAQTHFYLSPPAESVLQTVTHSVNRCTHISHTHTHWVHPPLFVSSTSSVTLYSSPSFCLSLSLTPGCSYTLFYSSSISVSIYGNYTVATENRFLFSEWLTAVCNMYFFIHADVLKDCFCHPGELGLGQDLLLCGHFRHCALCDSGLYR